ncbi:MAG: lysylphosphatidylglycerol synthase domain-containing protein [Bacteroidota bacterium]
MKQIQAKNNWYQHKLLNWGIKLLVVLLLAWTIHKQVFAKENAREIWMSFQSHFQTSNLHWLLLNFLLIPVNWALEALKWQQLIKSFSNYTFWRVFQAILAGVTVGIFTPNRVGEYGGRLLLVEPEHNWKAVLTTMVGSFAQLLVLLSFGLMGLIYFANTYLHLEQLILYLFFFLGASLIALMLFCFYNIDLLLPIAKRIPYVHILKKYLIHLKILSAYESKELSKALIYSVLRYLVYSTQYYFMLRFFGIEIDLFTAYAGIGTIYLIQSSIPLPPLIDLLARGEVALFIWGQFSTDEIAILGSTFTLFIFNLIVPATVGAIFILRVNVLKSLGYGGVKSK